MGHKTRTVTRQDVANESRFQKRAALDGYTDIDGVTYYGDEANMRAAFARLAFADSGTPGHTAQEAQARADQARYTKLARTAQARVKERNRNPWK